MFVDWIHSLTPTSGTVITFAWLLAYIIAQGIKVIIDIRRKGYFKWNDLFDGWGMPSAHTAVVVAVAFVIGWIDGVDSHLFSLSLVIAAIVIYDALNIRYHAGEQARILNKITAKLSKHHDDIETTQFKHPLGHTIPEVLGGTLVGIVTSLLAFLVHGHLISRLQYIW